MTTDTETPPSLWSRSRQWLTAFTMAMEYDSSHYTADRTASLQAELADLRTRIAQLESIDGASSTSATGNVKPPAL